VVTHGVSEGASGGAPEPSVFPAPRVQLPAAATWAVGLMGCGGEGLEGSLLTGLIAGGAGVLLGGLATWQLLRRRWLRAIARAEAALPEPAPSEAVAALAAPPRARAKAPIDGVFARQRARLDAATTRLTLSERAKRRREQELEETRRRLEDAVREVRAERDELQAAGGVIRQQLQDTVRAALAIIDVVAEAEPVDEQAEVVKLGRELIATFAGIVAGFEDPSEGADLPGPSSFITRRAVVGLVRALAPYAERSGLELVVRFADDVPSRVEADGARLRQVLLTVIAFVVDRGTGDCVYVNVAVAPRSPADDPGSVSLRVTVEGAGPSLSSEERAAIEGPAARATSPVLVARSLLEPLGSTLAAAASAPGAFALDFNFPVVRQKRVTTTTLFGRGALTERAVLVVDDVAHSRAVVSEQLASWRLLPTAVDSVAAGLEALRSAARTHQPFDLVVLDGQLGDGEGFELLRRVQRDPEVGGQRVILLDTVASSVRPLPDDVAGMVGARVVKPLLPSELLEALTGLLAPTPRTGRLMPRQGRVPTSELPPVRILVAEDNPVNQMYTARMLEKRAFQVTVANNGAQLIDYLDSATEPFDVILMDIQMPVLDGIETARILREREATSGGRRIPILAVTAHAADGEEQRCIDAGMDAYIPKPVVEERLITAIRAALPDSQGQGGARLADPPKPKADAAPTGGAEPTPATNGRVLDEAKVLDFVAGDQEFLTSLVELFVETSPRQVESIAKAIAAGDPRSLERSAHQLKGSVSNFSAERARHWALELERLGRAGRVDGAEPAFRHLSAEIKTLQEALIQLAERHTAC